RLASPAIESAEIAATASGRNSGSSTPSAASATNIPLLVMAEMKSGPSPRPPPPGGETLTAIEMRMGTDASTARPPPLGRRPKTGHRSERRNRVDSRRGRGIAIGAAAPSSAPPSSAPPSSAADIEALSGERDEQLLEVRRGDGEAADRYPVVDERFDHLL